MGSGFIAQLLHLGTELEEGGTHLAHEERLLLLEARDGAPHLDELVLLLVEVLEVAVGELVRADLLGLGLGLGLG